MSSYEKTTDELAGGETTMHCHAHITLEKQIDPPKGWKQTEILVTDGVREDHDVMLTRHFVVGGSKFPTLSSVLDEIKIVPGSLRVKVERTETWQIVDREHYAEFHVKVEEGAPFPTAEGWARSRNPRDRSPAGVPRYFYNKRVYSGEMEKIIEQVKGELQGVPYVELKIEQNIFDSNRQHDAWWA